MMKRDERGKKKTSDTHKSSYYNTASCLKKTKGTIVPLL